MRDAGVYTQLWKKYLPVIRLLLKKTADTDQKLQIYKHEFASTGAKNKLGYIFNLEIVNGKAVNKSAAIAVSFDLLNVLNDNSLTNEWLKGKNVKISVNKACELTMIYLNKPDASEAIIDEVITAEVAAEVTSA